MRKLLTRARRALARAPVPACDLGGAGCDYPLHRAYAVPWHDRVRVQADTVTFHYMCAFTGENCATCGLALMRCVGAGQRPFCTVCDSPTMSTDLERSARGRQKPYLGGWMTADERDFDPEDTAAIALYLDGLRERARAANAYERDRFEHVRWMRARANASARDEQAGYWVSVWAYPHTLTGNGSVTLMHGRRETRGGVLTVGGSSSTPETWAADRALIESFEADAVTGNDRLALDAAERSAVARAAADDRTDAAVAARAANGLTA